MSDSDKPRPTSALLVLLLAAATLVSLILVGVFQRSAWGVFFLVLAIDCFAVLVVISVRMIRRAGRREVTLSWGFLGPNVSPLIGAIALVVGIAALVVICALCWPVAIPILLYALAFSGFIAAAWTRASQMGWRRRRLIVLGHLQKAVQLNLPLPRMILAAAQSESGVLRRRLTALHDRLEAGEPLEEAIGAAVPEIPLHVAKAIGAGQRLGCLPRVLELLSRRRRAFDPWSPNVGIYWVYPLVIFGVAFFPAIGVYPKFQAIFRDFHMKLPPLTSFMINLFSDDSIVPAVLALVAVIASVAMVGRVLSRIFPSAARSWPWAGGVRDRVVWWTPLAGGLAQDRGLADLCDLLSAGVELGHPLGEILREIAPALPNAVMRRRVAKWAEDVTRGEPIQDAARRARLPNLLVSMLATARDGEGLIQVLSFLWRTYEYRLIRARAIFASAYVPVVVFLMGALVAVISTSLFQPITMLIQRLSSYSSGSAL